MKLYEINVSIAQLVDQLDVDTETGEVGENYDAVMDQIHALDMERTSILQYLAKIVLNIRAEAAMLKAEEQRLKERRDALTRKEDRLMKILDRECAGQKTPLGIATFSYRKTSHVEVADSEKAVKWLKRHKYLDCFRIPAPEVAKTEVKKLINSGVSVPGCAVVEDYSTSLK
ncbi:MAG: hypothetical protein GXY60_06170 [Spirochaetales bacterium]|nr:hypothetical protein [Spirochaetales bacterium]